MSKIDSVSNKGARRWTAALCLAVAIVLMIVSGRAFLRMHQPDTLYPGPGVTSQGRLSDYLPNLKGSPGDTDIYFLKGADPGGKFLVLGGTHNDEVAAQVTAITLVENAVVTQGELIVIPRINHSGSTATWEMQGFPPFIDIETARGARRIKTGSRYGNWAHGFPDPDVFVNVDGDAYPGAEARDLNRVHPGREDGYLAERVSHALIEFINAEQIDLVLDMHEANPDNYVVNCLIGHDRAMDLVAMTTLGLQLQGITDIKMFQSPKVYGFSHRAIGDNTDALAVLSETANMVIGAFRGKPTQQLLQDGKDPFYGILAKRGKLFVEYDPAVGISLDVRAGRHLSTVMELARGLSMMNPGKPIAIEQVPEYAEVVENGIAAYLEPKKLWASDAQADR